LCFVLESITRRDSLVTVPRTCKLCLLTFPRKGLFYALANLFSRTPVEISAAQPSPFFYGEMFRGFFKTGIEGDHPIRPPSLNLVLSDCLFLTPLQNQICSQCPGPRVISIRPLYPHWRPVLPSGVSVPFFIHKSRPPPLLQTLALLFLPVIGKSHLDMFRYYFSPSPVLPFYTSGLASRKSEAESEKIFSANWLWLREPNERF